eukprot:4947936-Amphidinium_carterae.1
MPTVRHRTGVTIKTGNCGIHIVQQERSTHNTQSKFNRLCNSRPTMDRRSTAYMKLVQSTILAYTHNQLVLWCRT